VVEGPLRVFRVRSAENSPFAERGQRKKKRVLVLVCVWAWILAKLLGTCSIITRGLNVKGKKRLSPAPKNA